MFIIAPLLYFVILNVLLLITGYFSLKIAKNTIGKNIKDQFNKKLYQKVFWFTTLSYIISITVLVFITYFDGDNLFDSLFDIFALYFITILLFPSIISGPTYSDQTIPCLAIAVLSAFLSSVIFNYFVVFKKLDLKKAKRFYAALIVSAMTAPYFYFVPFGGLFGDMYVSLL